MLSLIIVKVQHRNNQNAQSTALDLIVNIQKKI